LNLKNLAAKQRKETCSNNSLKEKSDEREDNVKRECRREKRRG
jgi:hypothetical protein